jgi:hypothetical protein
VKKVRSCITGRIFTFNNLHQRNHLIPEPAVQKTTTHSTPWHAQTIDCTSKFFFLKVSIRNANYQSRTTRNLKCHNKFIQYISIAIAFPRSSQFDVQISEFKSTLTSEKAMWKVIRKYFTKFCVNNGRWYILDFLNTLINPLAPEFSFKF